MVKGIQGDGFSPGSSLSDTLDLGDSVKLKERKKETIESDSESDLEENQTKRTTRVSTRDVTDLSLLSYILCIRTSVLRARNITLPQPPTVFPKAAYTTEEKYYVLPIGSTMKVCIKEFAAPVFEAIRRHTISTDDFLASWSKSSSGEFANSSGRSGAQFFFSADKKYLVKTISLEEVRWLVKILPAYASYLLKNPCSLLIRYLGLYGISEGKKKTYFTVTESIFDPDAEIDEFYDLKGSHVGRSQRGESGPLLDRDLTRKLNFGPEQKYSFMEQINQDVKLLFSQNLMDYSLLVGIVNESKNTEQTQTTDHSSSHIPGMVYFSQSRKKLKKSSGKLKPTVLHEPIIGAPPPKKSAMKRKKYCHTRILQSSLSMGSLPPKESPKAQKTLSDSNLKGNVETFYRKKALSCISGQNSEVYYVGIIDLLQKFNSKKKIAGFAKSLKHSKKQLSTVNPKMYSHRFVTYIDSIIE